MAIKNLILSSGLMLSSILMFGQNNIINAPFIIVSDIKKSHYYLGDTICFTIKNKTHANRGYTIEAINTNTNLKSNELYTAYFNNDTSFFVSLKRNRRLSKENNIDYLIPNAKLIPYAIAADSSSNFLFIVSGNKSGKGIKIKFRIIPDFINDEPDYIIETKPFWVFVNPM